MKKKYLVFTPMKFYSPEDEELFFNWINKIKCIKNYYGVGKQLEVQVSAKLFTFNDYRNLYGLFKRYKLKNPEQIKEIFLNESNKEWFE